ncbi:VWA domain-containing protein [Paraburkholderia bonniea]|uniref:vWA domain-containing protein n=1 Tax=Paraburkholderia bonniea TaxID=2152891 RepID=UPI002572470E|nr:VWA domain-containing protein [Paraburkholderia bonniea]WJF89927.1 VWA domain-containing protein [Paraburkholderia bonniea]WJF93241.1 VWA domain-containing protein [Paraburkholderia bonniea]
MWKFEFPWLFVLLPLPLFVWWLIPAYRTTAAAIRMPFFREMAEAAGEQPAPGGVRLRRNWLQRLLLPLLWSLLVLAAAKPVYVEAPIIEEAPARDLMLAIDLSGSMATRDFVNQAGERMDRLSAVKQVVADFITKRTRDRIGLVVFGDAAYPQAPLTLDHDSVQILLNQMQIGMAGPRTALGDAIGLTVKLMADSTAEEKVLILLTDGNDTSSAIPPERAAEIAKSHKLVVHTIGIGDPNTSGEDKVDLAALAQIASITGGRAFRALGQQQELAAVYATLDALTPQKIKREIYRPQRDYFWLPLAAALSLFTLYHVLAWLLSLLRAPHRATASSTAPTTTPHQADHGN